MIISQCEKLNFVLNFFPAAGHANPTISTPTPTPCYGDVVTLVCHHPELASNFDKYFDTEPGWRENNTKITSTTGIYIHEDTSEDRTHTNLTVNITVKHFKNKSFNYLCLLVLADEDGEASGSEKSGVVTVDPIGKYNFYLVDWYQVQCVYITFLLRVCLEL